ncbi:tail fiber domain-containing protein [Candidatus Parcubacteria bacterium]|nr:tail fiber domain-containing protein [Patescibacteria group bacterium]MCG2700528.1 tail fiber domain-containing protein [Candidatus Parcubacteria bacterium]
MTESNKVFFVNDKIKNIFNLLPDEDPLKKGIIKAIQDIRRDCQVGEATFTTGSSRTYKENINPVFVDNILDKISKIPVNTYDFKPELCNDTDDKCKNKIGLIAEDFHVIFERGDEKQLSGDEVRMALWLAVQELKAENEELKAELCISNPNYSWC